MTAAQNVGKCWMNAYNCQEGDGAVFRSFHQRATLLLFDCCWIDLTSTLLATIELSSLRAVDEKSIQLRAPARTRSSPKGVLLRPHR